MTRRATDACPGEATTDRRDAFAVADTARLRRRQVREEMLDQLRVLDRFDTSTSPAI